MRRTRILAVLSAAALLVSACSGSSGSGSSGGPTSSPAASAPSFQAGGSSQASTTGAPPAKGGIFTMGEASDPGNLDPSMTVLSVTRLVSSLAYDALVNAQDDGTVKSGLAKTWKTSANSVTLTMTKGATCSDGSPFTAKDAADNLNYIADPANKSPLLGLFLPAGVKATADAGAGTVTVTSPVPDAFLLQNLSGVFMVCAAGLKDHKLLAGKTIGTGPWVLSQVAPGDHYTYTKRAGYTWGPGGAALDQPGTPDSVNVRVIANPTTMANLLLAGQINFASVSGNDTKRLDAAKLATINLITPAGETWFNETAGRPGADPKVREALATGTDIAQIMKVAVAGKGGPSKGAITLAPNPCHADTVTANLPAFDVAKAKSMLDAAGWAVGGNGIRAKAGKPLAMTFLYLPEFGQAVTAAAELLASQWKALGVDVALKGATDTQLGDIVFSTGAWDAGWIQVGLTLPSQLVPFASGKAPPAGTNFGHIANSEYTATAGKAALAPDVATACPLWEQAEEALYKDFDIVPMYNFYASTYLKNAEASIQGGNLVGSSLRLTQG
ncbi:MAG: ABC transporter substrate-binding protein [Actinomycetota bacterium]|nr:ABC transporter substrate-binding protein [Actinomycetota bacterium]